MLAIIYDYRTDGSYKLNLNESQLKLLNYLNEQDITDMYIDIIKADDFTSFEKEDN